ncbi:PREDICTED: C-type lectin domain family 4 member K-like [Papilio xuthus]|uniref:C-type lectin domain family 4 member K-like n=1 Tax=Papilio xuthus TaxID=66420 RepID=A0AAJ7EKF4_PAPXU|nr:PREDICTED: C-type lectin domain family 4 member K-like [Papilio xuthus]
MLVVFIVLFSLAAANPRHKQYRYDYEYNSKTDAFYKLHVATATDNEAKSRCQKEGAELMTISSQDDVVQVHKMLKQFPDIGNYVLVTSDGLQHESAEETPLIYMEDPDWPETSRGQCNVVTREGIVETSNCLNKLPFMCKIKAINVIYDSRCKVYSSGYKYYNITGSCYKMSETAASWNRAYEDCHVVGAHLVIINSQSERSLLYDVMNAAPRVPTSAASWFILAGIRATDANNTRVFKTVFNQTLEEAGFAEWSPGEPNNASESEKCGSIFLNDAKYNDVDCLKEFAYMCENEIGIHQA